MGAHRSTRHTGGAASERRRRDAPTRPITTEPGRDTTQSGPERRRVYQPIEDYGIIGDLHTVALVGKNGSIDFMSFPRFDSPTIFAALLDDQHGGRFSHPARSSPTATPSRCTCPDTNVLLTRFLAAARVSARSPTSCRSACSRTTIPRVLVRRVKTVRGVMRFNVVFEPRFDYGRADHSVEQRDGEVDLHVEGSRRHGGAAAHRGADDDRRRRRRGRERSSCARGRVGGVHHGGGGRRACRARRPRPTTRSRRSRTRSELLAQLDRSVAVPRALARDRQPLRARAQAAVLTDARLADRRADVRAARADRRRAQLGLPVHVDPRRVVHAVRADPARLHRRGGRVHALDPRALHGPQPRRVDADHVRPRRPQGAHRVDAAEPRGLPRARRRCASATARTTSSSSTSTAS